MSKNSLNLNPETFKQQIYHVLLEHKSGGQVSASVIGWQDCQVEAPTKAEALTKLSQLISSRLKNVEIVSLELASPQKENPLMEFAGIFKDDPDFPQVLADIEARRKKLDLEMEEYYRQLDNEEKLE